MRGPRHPASPRLSWSTVMTNARSTYRSRDSAWPVRPYDRRSARDPASRSTAASSASSFFHGKRLWSWSASRRRVRSQRGPHSCSRSWPCSRSARCGSPWRDDDPLVWSELDAREIDRLAVAGVIGRKRDRRLSGAERNDLSRADEVERDQDAFALGLAGECEHPARRRYGAIGPATERGRCLPQPAQAAVQRKERRRIVPLRRDVVAREVAHRQPRVGGGEPRVLGGVPLHGRAFPVAAVHIDHARGRDRNVGHPDLLAVVDERRPPEGEEHDRGDAGAFRTVAGDRARAIVVREGVVGPGVLGEKPLPFLDHRTEPLGDPGLLEEMEVERKLELIILAVVAHVPPKIPHADLADGHAVAVIRVEDLPPAAMDLVHLVEVPIAPAWPPAQLETRVVAQALVSDQARGHVDAESIDAAVEPEAHDVVDGGADFLVAPVEVRLLR